MSNITKTQIQFDSESLVARVEGFAAGREPAREKKTPGTSIVEKYRPKMNKLSDAERVSLTAHAMQNV